MDAHLARRARHRRSDGCVARLIIVLSLPIAITAAARSAPPSSAEHTSLKARPGATGISVDIDATAAVRLDSFELQVSGKNAGSTRPGAFSAAAWQHHGSEWAADDCAGDDTIAFDGEDDYILYAVIPLAA